MSEGDRGFDIPDGRGRGDDFELPAVGRSNDRRSISARYDDKPVDGKRLGFRKRVSFGIDELRDYSHGFLIGMIIATADVILLSAGASYCLYYLFNQ